jgi:hypothetical protein
MPTSRARTESWAGVPVDAGLMLVYGPRWARLYLLPPAEALAPPFLRVIGLHGAAHDRELADPVDRIHSDRTHFTGTPAAPVPAWTIALYQAFDGSRHVVPLRVAARATPRLARLLQRMRRTADDAGHGPDTTESGLDPTGAGLDLDAIARTLHAVESRVRTPNCYPRALLTALLCLASGRACTLIVGVLAPTRKMHAWCCVDGVLPYEHLPEHYMYRPLWTLPLDP